MTPVNVLDRSLVGDALGEAQGSARAERSVILRRESLGGLLRQIDRRAEGDDHARNEQRGRTTAKNVSAKFAFRFHS